MPPEPDPAFSIRFPSARKGVPALQACLVVLSLLACSCTSEKTQVKALQKAMAEAACFPTGPGDVSFIDPIARGKKILFLGEHPHCIPEIHDAALRLSLHLRKELGYTVLGYEFPYAGRVIVEDQSLGGDAKMPDTIEAKWRLGQNNLPAWLDLVRYNRSAPEDRRLPCTVVDEDQPCTNPQLSVLYFEYLASRSSSSDARAEIAKAIPGQSAFVAQCRLAPAADAGRSA